MHPVSGCDGEVLKVCSVCESHRPPTDFRGRENTCYRCTAIATMLVREAFGAPVLNPGDNKLEATLRLISDESAEEQAEPLLVPYLGVCGHCGLPASKAYSWGCSRGYPEGICEGIKVSHRHYACVCGYEELG